MKINAINLVHVLVLLLCIGCQKEAMQEHEIAAKWADLSIDITKNTPANSPTFASRCFGYIGLTMYESIVPGYSEYQSMAGQLSDLEELPTPMFGKKYNWKLALNAGQAEILRKIYVQTADSNKLKIDVLEDLILSTELDFNEDEELVKRSINFGKQIAQSIFEWSKTDGGHRGYLNNFDKKMVHASFLGSWKPPLYSQSFSHHPLHPYWGKNRTFTKTNKELPLPEFIVFDSTENSAYFQEFLAVYEKDKTLNQSEKEAAIWWGDDPDETATPPGHSYYIATLVIREKQPSLIESAATFAKLGMALSDAFVNCWKWKYHFFSERPNTFIPKYIDEEWESFWPDPPFPCFPSGHAIQASSAATVFAAIYGDDFHFVDRIHEGRERDELREVDFKPRTFDGFWEVAQETADSRFYGGIHTHQDNKIGLEKGKVIAENVLLLNWKKVSQ